MHKKLKQHNNLQDIFHLCGTHADLQTMLEQAFRALYGSRIVLAQPATPAAPAIRCEQQPGATWFERPQARAARGSETARCGQVRAIGAAARKLLLRRSSLTFVARSMPPRSIVA
eukprot:365390-Chlamydomonas_euryale.AAC.4